MELSSTSSVATSFNNPAPNTNNNNNNPVPNTNTNTNNRSSIISSSSYTNTHNRNTFPVEKHKKSWNGCATCKAKRAKCDEAKPACKRCTDRGWVCGGYKKKFVFKSFEETLEASKRNAAKRRSSASAKRESMLNNIKDIENSPDSKISELDIATSRPLDAEILSKLEPYKQQQQQQLKDESAIAEDDEIEDIEITPVSFPSPTSLSSPNSIFSLFLESMSGEKTPCIEMEPLVNTSSKDFIPEDTPMSNESGFGESSSFEFMSLAPFFLQTQEAQNSSQIQLNFARQPFLTLERFTGGMIDRESQLLHLYDKRTCAILTVTDGLNENGWRDILFPLTQSSPSLNDAIKSLTAFHMAALKPEYRQEGVRLSRKSMKLLHKAITKCSDDQGLIATSLVLSMADIWNKKTTHSLAHIEGAHKLLSQRLFSAGMQSLNTNRTMRFLYNTYLYMDIISALTNKSVPFSVQFPVFLNSYSVGETDITISSMSADDDYTTVRTSAATAINDGDIYETENSEPAEKYTQSKIEIDPLLGCSASLFPIIGRAISAANRLRGRKLSERLDQWTLAVLSQGIAVRDELIRWRPPPNDKSAFAWIPSDPSCELHEVIQTASAYRLSALLYLYEAVPQFIPDLHRPLSRVYTNILSLLKSVPGTSRTITVHLWPLLTASVYAEGEDREWVEQRFDSMRRILCLGNVDAGWDVVCECWKRRSDAKNNGQACEGTQWQQVMDDWGWNLFLG